MINKDLLEELKSGWVLTEDKNSLKEVNYDTIARDQLFAVKLKTGSYTIMRKSDTFDDEVLKSISNFENTLSMLRQGE